MKISMRKKEVIKCIGLFIFLLSLLASKGFAEIQYFSECPVLLNPLSLDDNLMMMWNFAMNTEDTVTHYMYCFSYNPPKRIEVFRQAYLKELENIGFSIQLKNNQYELSTKGNIIAEISNSEESLEILIPAGNQSLYSIVQAVEDKEDTMTNEDIFSYDDENCLIFDKDGLRVILTGTYKKGSLWIEANVILENNTDYDLYITYSSIVNGWNAATRSTFVNEFLTRAHTKSKTSFTVKYSDTDITEINQLETAKLFIEGKKESSSGATVIEGETGIIHFHTKH